MFFGGFLLGFCSLGLLLGLFTIIEYRKMKKNKNKVMEVLNNDKSNK